jgi:hypothetical protein
MITAENFHLRTFANFTKVDAAPSRKADFRSDSGSCYWYECGQVIRQSNHWGGRIASCSWFLNGDSHDQDAVGACDLADFHAIQGNIEYAPKHLWAAMSGTLLLEDMNGLRWFDEKFYC